MYTFMYTLCIRLCIHLYVEKICTQWYARSKIVFLGIMNTNASIMMAVILGDRDDNED